MLNCKYSNSFTKHTLVSLVTCEPHSMYELESGSIAALREPEETFEGLAKLLLAS